jgi:hypothetical protein
MNIHIDALDKKGYKIFIRLRRRPRALLLDECVNRG